MKPRLDLLLISGLILYLELALIRWLPAHVLFLSFFTNTVLLASFLGMSIGCLQATKPQWELRRVPFWLAITLALALLVELFRGKFERFTDVGNQASPEVVFFGTEVSAVHGMRFVVPVELIAGAFFFLTAAIMVGLGQELGRALNRIPSRTTAYSLDLLGSLSGIVLFSLCSLFQLPPIVWFGIVTLGIMYFLTTRSEDGLIGNSVTNKRGIGLLVFVLLLTLPTSGLWNRPIDGIRSFWSPYYRVDYQPKERYINTNQISHQIMHHRNSPKHVFYDQPYLFQDALNRPMFKRILIIGAGSGNDLSHALYWCPPDAIIDAVEIDPVIQSLGAKNHPNQPYSDPRVRVHLNDGRNFLRRAPDAEYDLVIFALVDSLVLHSGYSNIRLESYLFTQESFLDVARVLKPDGIAAVYNFFRQGWIVARIRDEMRTAFHSHPLVLTVNVVDMQDASTDVPLDGGVRTIGGFTAIIAGREQAIQPIHAKFAESGQTYWLPGKVGVSKLIRGGFQQDMPETPLDEHLTDSDRETSKWLPADWPQWIPLRPAHVPDSPADLVPATDDWPFLYVRTPSVPALTLRGTALIVVLSGLVWFLFRDRTRANADRPADTRERDNPGLYIRAFLLGAGFMLIETRAVVQMALLFGSTWVVNTVVFGAILVMALAGNLFAGWWKPRRLELYYLGLFATLGANLLIPVDSFLGMDRGTQTLAACALAFAPVAFAGVVFPVSFQRSKRPDRFFGANVAGALLGGLAENLSMLLGFRLLLLVAVGLYGLSGLFGSRTSDTSSVSNGV